MDEAGTSTASAVISVLSGVAAILIILLVIILTPIPEINHIEAICEQFIQLILILKRFIIIDPVISKQPTMFVS